MATDTSSPRDSQQVDREDAAERERRMAGLTRKRVKRHDLAAERGARTLLDALDDGRRISRRELREMVRTYQLPVISLYLVLAPTDPAWPKPVMTLFHSLRHDALEARKQLIATLSHQARQALEVDLLEIEKFLESFDPRGAHGLVLFKSGAQLNRVVTLPVRVANRMTIEADPYIEPLDALLARQRTALVVFIEKDQARLLIHQFGRQTEVERITSFVPADTVDKSRPGKLQRHRLTHRQWHMRDVVRRAEETFAEHDCDVLVLAGFEPELGIFREMLPYSLRTVVVGSIDPSPRWTASEWERAVEGVLDSHRAEEEAKALEDLGFYQAHGRLATGLRDVIAAADDFFIRELYVRGDLEHPGYVCPDHHFLALEPGRCPFCGNQLSERENVVEELVEVSRRYGVDVLVVEKRADLLEPYGGIAALKYPMEAE
jgi:peptide subunit release factor 1 (eRF1)